MEIWLTTIGVMLIPLAVTLLQAIDNFSRFWFSVIMVIGIITIIFGLRITLKESNKRLKQYDLQIRREKAFLIVLTHMAESLGVDMDKVLKTMEDKLDDK